MRSIHLVGSIPLSNSSEVFTTVANVLGGSVKRIPDGETGKRTGWMRWQEQTFANDSQFEKASTQSTTHATGFVFQNYRLRDNVDPSSVRILELEYASYAKASYSEFAQLKQNRVIPEDARFQVCLPTPIGLLWSYVVPEQHAIVEAPLIDAFHREIEEILNAIPQDQLAIQWDTPHDLLVLEGVRTLSVDVSRKGLLRRWKHLCEAIPPQVDLGFHLCYGDSGGKHSVEPSDMGVMTDFANGLVESLSRSIQFLHMPVPHERNDTAFFAPLAELNASSGTELYLGLIHFSDGVEGARRRIAAARETRKVFGLATECGFGRRPPATVRPLLDLHAELAAAD